MGFLMVLWRILDSAPPATHRYEFALFIVALYVLAIYLGKYVDKPASAWIQDRLVAAVK